MKLEKKSQIASFVLLGAPSHPAICTPEGRRSSDYFGVDLRMEVAAAAAESSAYGDSSV